jgi:hypothetical protein
MSETRQRFITTWRKPDAVLDWDHYVSEDRAEVEQVVANIRKQGAIQYHTFPIGDKLPDLSSEF